MSILGEYYSFIKIFRDLQKHVNVGLKLYQARRTDSDSKFRDLFESLDAILQPLETHQKKIADRAAEWVIVVGSKGQREQSNKGVVHVHNVRCLMVT